MNLKHSSASTLKVAVTGSAGSGKTSVCRRLRQLGLKLISSDVVAREVVQPGSPALKKIVDGFGCRVLTDDGCLNRKMLRRIITQDSTARQRLERIVQPAIILRIHEEIRAAEKSGLPVIVVEVPLLFELGMEDSFDVVVLVSVDTELQIKRIMERDHVTRKEAKALLDIQMPEELKRRRSDIFIDNNGTLEEMIKSVDRFYFDVIKKRAFSTQSP